MSRVTQQRPVTVTSETDVVQCDVVGCKTESLNPAPADLAGWLLVRKLSGETGALRSTDDQHFCPAHAVLALAKLSEAKR